MKLERVVGKKLSYFPIFWTTRFSKFGFEIFKSSVEFWLWFKTLVLKILTEEISEMFVYDNIASLRQNFNFQMDYDFYFEWFFMARVN